MERTQLKAFLAVARSCNFTKAATTTNMTQSGISQHVQSLEKEFGTTLFDRSNLKKIKLTDEGEIFRKLVEDLMEDWGNLASRFNELRGNAQKGSVRIATHTSVMVYLLPDVIRNFKSKYPECELSIVNRGRSDILKMLNEGEVDIGIASKAKASAVLDYKPFTRYKRILITQKNHPLAQKAKIGLETIAQYPLILPPVGSNTRLIIDQKFQEKDLDYKLSMEITGRQAIKTYVGMGMGISIINEFYLTKEDKKQLFTKDMSGIFGRTERGIFTRKGKYLSTHAKEFVKILLRSS